MWLAGQELETVGSRHSSSIPGMPVPHSAAKALAMQTLRAPHTMVPASLAAQPDPASTSSPPHCPALWKGAVWGELGGGPRPGPFLQGRKGLLGWLGMPQRMNGHANEMLMNTDQASPESSPGSCPLSSRQGGAPHPDSPASVGRPSGPSTETFLGGMGSSLGLLPGPYASSFLCLESQPGRCPSSGPDCPQRGPGREGLSVPPLPAPRHNGAVSLLLRSESRGKSLPGQD